MPEVTVVELPSEPAGFAAALRDEPVFERLMLSDEDRSRTRYYVEQRQRAEAAAGAATLESYYEFLQQEVEIEPVGPGSIARAAQLTQKTNQFNLTTRRYSEQEIQALAGKPGWTVYAARARDRFGDNGVIGIAILRAEGPTAEIDTFLLSCRVIGRGIETALLAHVVAECRAGGVVYLEGRFRPTAKNAPAAGFYRDHGFQPETTGETGALWRIAVAQANIECPGWIKLKSEKPRTLAQYVHI
jgi:FkbH-like protein